MFIPSFDFQHHPDVAGDTPESRGKFIEINEAFSVLGNGSKRKEYDLQRRINALSVFESGYKMEYPQFDGVDSALKEAYEQEMRRCAFILSPEIICSRWNNRLIEWARGQGEYELERGHHVKPLPSHLSQSYIADEYAKQETYILFGFVAFVAGTAYIYVKV